MSFLVKSYCFDLNLRTSIRYSVTEQPFIPIKLKNAAGPPVAIIKTTLMLRLMGRKAKIHTKIPKAIIASITLRILLPPPVTKLSS